MDVNGTKFHLLYGQSDWESCLVVGHGDQTLGALEQDDSGTPPGIAWYGRGGYLGLRSEPRLFQQALTREDDGVQIENRRGAAADEFGAWYWLDPARQVILRLRPGQSQPDPFYPPPAEPSTGPAPAPSPGDFVPDPSYTPLSEPAYDLGTLVITPHHYLVASIQPISGEPGGLLVFDLYAQGQTGGAPAPILISFAPGDDFVPDDMAGTPDGGLLLLSTSNLDTHSARLRRLDSTFARPGPTPAGGGFQPAGAVPAQNDSGSTTPQPLDLLLTSLPGRAISVEAGPEGSVLILCDPDQSPAPSVIVCLSGPGLTDLSVPILLHVDVHDPNAPLKAVQEQPVRAADIVYLPLDPARPDRFDWLVDGSTLTGTLAAWLDRPAQRVRPPMGILVVADSTGNQAIAYTLAFSRDTNTSPAQSEITLAALSDYLPMRHWTERGLVGYGSRAYYDYETGSGQVRWLPLTTFGDPRYALRGALITPGEFLGELPVQPFDGENAGCVWHRLLIDADIPPGTRISIRARATDNSDVLAAEVWREQPALVRRSGGSELPFYTLPALRPPDPAAALTDSAPVEKDDAGTWELLFQELRGRYVQLEITLEGTGAVTPRLYALRAWYPRFSYLTYLPAIYREHPIHSAFLERFLANFEGLFTHLEDQIEQVAMLFDPRIAPAETLDWLAGWLGLLLDPMWKEAQRRFFLRHVMTFYRQRGTMNGLYLALRLYLEEDPSEDLLETSAGQGGPVRLLEWVRWVDAGQPYDPDDPAEVSRHAKLRRQAAHRFIVWVPTTLSDAEISMIVHILRQEKPAHTDFDIERRDDALVICGSVLGLDSRLCPGPIRASAILGSSALARSTLTAQYPQTITSRMMITRDVLRDLSLPARRDTDTML